MNPEQISTLAGAGLLIVATVRQWRVVGPSAQDSLVPLPRILALALILIALGLAMRWHRLGHGPFFTMYEILASNILSLGIIIVGAAALWPVCRPAMLFATPVLCLMAIWLMTVSPQDSHFAPTYATPILWAHVLAGKLFLGCALISLGLAGLVLARRLRWWIPVPFRRLDVAMIDTLSWHFLRLALVFDSAMLLAGAVWAQDAWGRYWDWDPLETWAFVTWLGLLVTLHWRTRSSRDPAVAAALIWAVFALAFLTFFGVPFISVAPHKGAV